MGLIVVGSNFAENDEEGMKGVVLACDGAPDEMVGEKEGILSDSSDLESLVVRCDPEFPSPRIGMKSDSVVILVVWSLCGAAEVVSTETVPDVSTGGKVDFRCLSRIVE